VDKSGATLLRTGRARGKSDNQTLLGMRSSGRRPRWGDAQGFARLEVALPSRPDISAGSSIGGFKVGAEPERGIIGMDPYKRSITIEVVAAGVKIGSCWL
jgi:hypothetical protein